MLVSIALCTKGAEKYIDKCISSLLAQEFKDFEIIIVEDPPFDKTKEIIDAFRDERIKFMRNKKRLGLTKSRNKSIKFARGKYIFFTDADCLVSKNWIDEGLKSFINQSCNAVEGKTYYVSDSYQPTYSDNHAYVKNMTGGQYMTCNMAYEREIIGKVGGFDEKFDLGSEDRDLALKVMKIGKITF